LARRTAFFVMSVFYCSDVCRTSLMRLLVLCTPSSNGVTQMRAPVLSLSVVTHVEGKDCRAVVVEEND